MNKLKLLVDDREAEEGYLMWTKCPSCGCKDQPVVVLYNAEVTYHTTMDEDGAIVIDSHPFISCGLEDEYLECSRCRYQVEIGEWNPVIGGCIEVCIVCMDEDELMDEFDVVYLEDGAQEDDDGGDT